MPDGVDNVSFWTEVLEFVGAMLSGPMGCGGPSVSPDADEMLGEVQLDSYVTSCVEGVPPKQIGLKINELLSDAEGPDAGAEWIELFNKSGQTINVNGFTVSNREGVALDTLPDWSLPPCSYMVVHFGQGANDNNFLNGAAHFFTNSNLEIFNNNQDEVALYNGAPSANTIIDFIAYSALETFSGGTAHNLAVAANIWGADDYIDTMGWKLDPTLVRVIPTEGDTLGRDRYSIDTNVSADWAALGGVHSLGPTPGEANFIPIFANEPVQEIEKQGHKKWTVLFYMAADNNLDGAAYKDLNKLEEVGSPENVHVAVMADLQRDFNQKMGGINSSAYIHIQKDDSTSNDMKEKYLQSHIQLISETNTGSSKTLADFLKWGMDTFPADRYYLVIWGHGGGWKGTASDDVPKDRLTMVELQEALGAGPDIGILGFMSCMMGGIEVAHQIQEKVDYMIASQEVVWAGSWGSWPWDKIIAHMNNNPNISSADLAKFTIVETDVVYAGDPNRTLSVVNLGEGDFDKLVSEFSKFAEFLKKGMEDYGAGFTINDKPEDNVQVLIKEMLIKKPVIDSFPTLNTSAFSGGDPVPDYRDILDLVNRVNANNGIVKPKSWKETAGEIVKLIGKVVIEKRNSNKHQKAGGLSVYFPLAHTTAEHQAFSISNPSAFDLPLPKWPKDKQELYAQDDDPIAEDDNPSPVASLTFTKATLWDEFLNRYYNPVADASCNGKSGCQASPGETVILNAVGSSDADGELVKYCWDLNVGKNSDNGDFDKDNKDENDDDCDVPDKKTQFTCLLWEEDASYLIRLMVWDNHHKVTGHSKHHQVDDAYTTVMCITPR